MEPNYTNLDPTERTNRFLAVLSILLGSASICVGIVPIIGVIGGAISLFAGIRGRHSDSKTLATVGIVISAFALTISVVYAIFVQIGKYGSP